MFETHGPKTTPAKGYLLSLRQSAPRGDLALECGTISSERATQFVKFLRAQTRLLATLYQRGRPVAGFPSFRHLTIQKRAKRHGYVVVYEIREAEVFVLCYFHTAQDWEAQLQTMLQGQ